MVQRVVYNSCYGGFGLHEDVVKWVRANREELEEEYNKEDIEEIVESTISGEYFSDGSGPKGEYIEVVRRVSRDNELMADIVERETEYDGRTNGTHSNLMVAEVPDGVSWTIDEYDGSETVREKARSFS